MAKIELKDVRKVYPGGVEAVKGVSLSIPDGEFVVLVGPSGCGKSTLLRMVAGLETISSGTVSIGDKVVNDLEPAERDIAMVFQNYALYPHMTVRGNLQYGLKNRKMASAEIARRVDEAAKMLEIGALLERRPGQLSGGQRQRVAMGRALVREPAAFLFDEPLSNLDAKLRVQMRAEIRRLQRRLKTTSLYVTHDQLEAMTLADQLVVLNAGRIEQAGSPMDIYEKPASLFVATFIGSPAMNILPVGAHGVPGLAAPDGFASVLGSSQTLGVRPEHMNLIVDPADGSTTPGDAVFDLTVSGVEVVGAESFVYGALPQNGPEVAVRVAGYSHLEPGTKVRATAAPEAFHRFDQENGRRIEAA